MMRDRVGLFLCLLVGLSLLAVVAAEDDPFFYSTEDGMWSMRWSVDKKAEVATFELTSRYDGWLGIGFSENEMMADADYIITWVDKVYGSFAIGDRYTHPSNSRWTPKFDFDMGGKDDIFAATGNRTVVDEVPITTVRFSRSFATGDKYDVDLSNREIYVLYGYGDVSSTGSLSAHSTTGRGVIMINLFTGINAPVDRSLLMVLHCILMITSWSLLIVPSALLARYFKHAVPAWFKYHWMVMLLAFAMISAAFVLIFIEKLALIISFHSVIGIVLVGLAFLQGILGKISDAMWSPGKIPSFWPDKVHWLLGYSVILLALLCNFLGFVRLGSSSIPIFLYAAYVLVTLIFIIFFECKVGQTGEYESLNTSHFDEELKSGRGILALFWVYWAVCTVLVCAAMYFAFF